MIRAVLGLFVFAVSLCAYIVTRPGPVAAPVEIAPPAVTRAATESLIAPVTIPAPEPVVAPAPPPVIIAEPRIVTTTTSMDETTTNILVALGLDVEMPRPADQTADLLAAIGAATAPSQPPDRPAGDRALEELIVAALQQGRPDAEIDEMVNLAARAGDVSVPDVLVTENGRVDTSVLLQSLVAQARIAAGGAAPVAPEVPEGDGTGVEVRVVQRATETENYTFYTVNRGDSLGSIAVKFYGDVTRYPLIFDANRKILSSPDRIRVGQRLAIPDLPEV